MLKFIKEGWGPPEYPEWYCTIGNHGRVTAIAQGSGVQGACLYCAIREGIAIETIRTPRPNKKLLAYADAANRYTMCELPGGVEWFEALGQVNSTYVGRGAARALILESLAYSNPRG